MENEKIKVTVYLSTYNQQEYVAEALDSILMQKTDFRYEIIAADDCSTDDTQKIILDYQKRYPGMIETYFTNPNVGGCKKLTNCIDMGLFRGEYLAFLEGDDYWLGEDRLQTLVDFLEEHPEYSRVSHQRKIINEKDEFIGWDVPEELLNSTFTIENFLRGQDYSDFASVFRNYFSSAGSKYHGIICSSRNVCDFQDMFITQDYGPVYIMEQCYAVYRSRSIVGESNYNSITSSYSRALDHLLICKTIEEFYGGKYDLSPSISKYQKRMLTDAVSYKKTEMFTDSRKYITDAELQKFLPELLYLAYRGKRFNEAEFILNQLNGIEKIKSNLRVGGYFMKRIKQKLLKVEISASIRGYINY